MQIIEGDGLPPYICQKCIARLNVAFQFKTQCENADAKLRQCFESMQQLSANQELTGFITLKKDSEVYVEGSHSDGVSDNDQMQETNNHLSPEANGHLESTDHTNQVQEMHDTNSVQVTSHMEEQHPSLQTLENVHLDPPSSLLDKTTLHDLKLELCDLKPPGMELKVEDLNDLNFINVSVSSTNSKAKKPVKQHQCDTCGKVFRTKPGLVHHIRIHTGERPYVCHLCDKRFINGGHLHTHMRTHTGEKNHICAACEKAFATAQQLTKHTIAIHTSERPYGCTYCTKRFASSSNLNTHIKIHTGEKNYHCDQCGKAFSTKGQLYQHMLVHTGEKAFLCEYCNKRFSQKAHLIRHLKMHKNQ